MAPAGKRRTIQLADIRCPECDKLLLKLAAMYARVEVKCPGCKVINIYNLQDLTSKETVRTA